MSIFSPTKKAPRVVHRVRFVGWHPQERRLFVLKRKPFKGRFAHWDEAMRDSELPTTALVALRRLVQYVDPTSLLEIGGIRTANLQALRHFESSTPHIYHHIFWLELPARIMYSSAVLADCYEFLSDVSGRWVEFPETEQVKRHIQQLSHTNRILEEWGNRPRVQAAE